MSQAAALDPSAYSVLSEPSPRRTKKENRRRESRIETRGKKKNATAQSSQVHCLKNGEGDGKGGAKEKVERDR